MITDMTTGAPGKILLKFSIPMILSAVFQQMYNIADSVIAGQFVGKDALATIGASYPVTMIYIAVAIGLSVGSTVVISRHFGAHEFKDTKTAIFTSIIAGVVAGFFFLCIGVLLCPNIVKWLNTPPEIINDSVLYLRIYTYGLAFLFLYNICNGIYIALGDSRTPLIFLIISSVSNVGMNIFFVVYCGMGVDGIALATFICQGACSVASLIWIIVRIRRIKTEGSYPKYSFNSLKRIMHIAFPSILQQSFISIGNVFVQGLINSLGVDVAAGYSAAIKLNNFAITSFSTTGNSISSFVSQNLGGKKPQRVKQGFKTGLAIVCIAAVIFTGVFLLFNGTLIEIFLDGADVENSKAIENGMSFLKIVSPFYLVVAAKLISDGVLRGSGQMKTFTVSTLTDFIIRVGGAFIFVAPFGIIGIWWAWPIGWIISSAMSCRFYARSDFARLSIGETSP